MRKNVGCIGIIIIGMLVVVSASCNSAVLKTAAQWKPDRYIRMWESMSGDSVIRIEGKIPMGYTIVAIANFESGPITVECSERYMMEKAEEFCRLAHATAYIIFDVKPPDISNTCFRAKMIILKK